MKKAIFTICLAAVLWTVMFSPWTAPYTDFWLMMPLSGLILSALSTVFFPQLWNKVHLSWGNLALGAAIAAALWGIFWIGDVLSSLLFNFARPQVEMIYGIKDGASPWLLSIMMLFLIGPAEEIFWRGYIQETFSVRWGKNTGFIVTTLIYALVHVASFNFMLIMAALVAGAVWGLLYRLFPEKFAAIIISHAIWDAAVFIWFPI